MKDKILKRIECIKAEMQVHLNCQKNYKWSAYEKENGSEQYGRYQEREEKCVLRIRELEWVLNGL